MPVPRAFVRVVPCLTLAMCAAPASPGTSTLPPAMFRATADHQAVYDAPTGSFAGVRWRFATQGPVRSSPTLYGELLLVGSDDGNLYALDLNTGAERWHFAAGSAIESSPAAAGDQVFLTSRTGILFAVDAGTGVERWRFQTGAPAPFPSAYVTGDYYVSSPVLFEDLVLFGAADGNLYAVSAADGRERWRLATGAPIRATPAVGDSVVYVGSLDGSLYAANARTGAALWRFDTEGRSLNSADYGFDRRTIQSSPAIAYGTVFFGSRDGHVYAVDAAAGTLRWRVSHDMSWPISSPALAVGHIYIGTSDGAFFQSLASNDGTQQWRRPTARPVWSSPAVAGDMVYYADTGGTLYAARRATGEELWRYRAGSAIFSSPLLARGAVYFGCDDGYVYAVGTDATQNLARAVFWDSTVIRSIFNRRHRELRDHLAGLGYAVLDTAALARFLSERLQDHAPSVVVFAMDYLPPNVATPPTDSSLFRRFLDAGGKVVWPGVPPLMWPRDPATGALSYDQIDRAASDRLLGVQQGSPSFDRFGTTATVAGERWGLRGWWLSDWAADTSSAFTALAADQAGHASSWVRGYGGAPGTGFVRLDTSLGPDFVRAVAEYMPEARRGGSGS